MKKMASSYWRVAVVMMAVVLASCKTGRMPDTNDIAIEWEVVSNLHTETSVVKSRFVITNNSRFTFTDANWTLFYSQLPRMPLRVNEEARVTVEHINGDWFRIVPQPGFLLEPGQSIEIVYESSGYWIKESDGPAGLYFVLNDADGAEHIVEVLNFTILPFVRPEQIHRGHNDLTPIPTPEWMFENNQAMHLLTQEKLLKLVPTPVSLSATGESITLSGPITVYFTEGLDNEANQLANTLSALTGIEVNMAAGKPTGANTIFLATGNFAVAGKRSEAYRLNIAANQTITIEGTDQSGVFYGAQSLIALLPIDLILGERRELILPVLRIEDAPRFVYRGLHIDVSRNFKHKDAIMKVMNIMAFYKLNTLHLHLTDDEGWRLEIPGLPELTEVGAQRGHTEKTAAALHPAYGSGPFPYAEGRHGSGYFSREDFIEILEHANNLHIRVIPEINLPGHARAAVKAMEARYQRFMAEGNAVAANEFRLIDPEETSQYYSAQQFTDNVVNVARESAYHFIEKVVDEVIEMYSEAGAPLELFHIGGDEVPYGAWTRSPMVDEKMKTLPDIRIPANMHTYFTRRVLDIFSQRNLRMAGWEEIALKTNPAGQHVVNPEFAGGNVVPYVWNNLWGRQKDLAYRLANINFPVVLCHVTNFYFDLAYSKDPKEPGLYWGGFIGSREPWHYNPFNVFYSTLRNHMGEQIDPATDMVGLVRILPQAKRNILGLQAQMWSETIFGQEMLEYYLLPKLAGFSESAWAPARVWETTPDPVVRARQVEEGWNIFANTLAQRELPRLSRLHGGFNYRVPHPGAVVREGMLQANIEYPGLTIRFTTDGNEPTVDSPVYEMPVEVAGETIKLRAFDRSGRGSRTVTINLDTTL
jgi:hexosaminidase